MSYAFTPSVIILGDWATVYVEDYSVQIAPWVMGAFADLFLQGILAAQTANYFNFRDVDNTQRRFTWLVIFLTILCCLKTAQNISIVWDTVLANFANPDVSGLLVATAWSHYTTSLSTAVIATYVQAFFTYRYWMLTRRWYICAIMLCGMVVSLVGAALVIVYLPKLEHAAVKTWSLVHFVAAIIVDTLITACTARHLQRHKSTIQSTAQTVNRLIRMTWQSALPPTICVIVNAAVLEARPLELTHIAFNMVLPKLYAVSLMYTLNLRNELRDERASREPSSAGSRSRPTLGIGKQPSLPGRSGGFGPGGGGGGGANGPSRMERGVSFIGGKRRGLSFSDQGGQEKKLDGIHVETSVSRDGVSSGNAMELRNFEGQGPFGKATSEQNSEFEQDVWEPDMKYNAH